jgi:hypothetical protein
MAVSGIDGFRVTAVAVNKTAQAVTAQGRKLQLGLTPRHAKLTSIKRTQRIVVVGATGCVGSELLRHLVGSAYYGRALAGPLSRTDGPEGSGVEVCPGEMRDCPSLLSAFGGADNGGRAILGSLLTRVLR